MTGCLSDTNFPLPGCAVASCLPRSVAARRCGRRRHCASYPPDLWSVYLVAACSRALWCCDRATHLVSTSPAFPARCTSCAIATPSAGVLASPAAQSATPALRFSASAPRFGRQYKLAASSAAQRAPTGHRSTGAAKHIHQHGCVDGSVAPLEVLQSAQAQAQLSRLQAVALHAPWRDLNHLARAAGRQLVDAHAVHHECTRHAQLLRP